jgi:signal transduction histidine kinase
MFFVSGLFLSVFIAGWLTISAVQRRLAGVGASAFAAFGIWIALWAIGELLLMSARGPSEVLVGRRVFYLGAAGLPPTWFWVATRAARPAWYVRRPGRVALAFLLPGFFYSCLYWDQQARFVHWTAQPPSPGPWFDAYTFHQYALVLVAAAFFVRAALRVGRTNLPVMAAIVTGVALPFVANLVYYVDWVVTDWTAIALGPSAALIWVAAIHTGVASRLPTECGDVIEQLDVGVVVADPDGRIVSANPAAVKLIGIGDLRGRRTPEAIAAAEQRSDKAIETRAIVLRGRFGTTGHALILADRTDAERSRHRLELGGRLEALGSLTAGIAHEVNNPLAFIQANLTALEDTAKALREPEARAGWSPVLEDEVDDMGALLEETREGVERIRDLVQRLKSFARTPDLEATAVEVDLDRAVRQAAAIATIGHAPETIRFEGEHGLRVISVETAVFQILVNLLLNAVQAARGEPDVLVRVARDGAGIAIRVADRGPGIAAHLLPRIFDPFFTTKPTGTGLGLSLSYDLARRLGAHLSASNREEGGACFTLWLPFEPPGQAEPSSDGGPSTGVERTATVA